MPKNIYEFTKSSEEYDLRVSITKTKIMVFPGKRPVLSKIVLYDTVLEETGKTNLWYNTITTLLMVLYHIQV